MTERWHPDERLPVIARFEVRRRAYLAPDGSINRQLLAFASDTRLLVRLYRAMVLVRAFDMKAVALQRTGRLGTYAASLDLLGKRERRLIQEVSSELQVASGCWASFSLPPSR